MKGKTMKKITILMLAVFMVISCLSGAVSAGATDLVANETLTAQIKQNTVTVEFETAYDAEIGAVSKKESIIIDGVENYLYPTFDDIDDSLELLEEAIPNYYSLVQEQVNLKALYEESWENQLQANVFPEVEYNKKATQKSVNPDSNSLTVAASQNAIQREEKIYEAFYDIYENNAKNKEIKEYLRNNPNPDAETLAMLLPYNSPFSIEYFQTRDAVLSASPQYFNIESGITYAAKYAALSNYEGYGNISIGGDCTNFASQILVAGGIMMHDMYPDEQSGWWHRRTYDGLGHSQHHFSVSWINADRFVKFMGTSGNEYTSFYTFSGKLNRGDFIAFDSEKDGDWNHVGFATAIGSYGTYSYTDDSGVLRSKYYRDFKVAQHTHHYHAWTSAEINGWEKLDGTAKFAIVRRNAVA